MQANDVLTAQAAVITTNAFGFPQTIFRNIKAGDRISFTYDEPKNGPAQRTGRIDRIYRAKHYPRFWDGPNPHLLMIVIFDETAQAYRQFRFRNMRDIRAL